MNILSRLFKEDNTFLIFLLSSLTLIFGIYLPNIYLQVISSIFLFAAWDSFGFKYVLTQDQTIPIDKESLPNAGYRICQTTFQIILSVLLFSISGIYAAAAFMIGWWFGTCDLIYYLCTKEKFWEWGDMNWVWWTPIGLILSIFKKDVPPIVFIIQSIIGLVLAIVVILQFEYNFFKYIHY